MDQSRFTQIRKQKGFEIANKSKIISQNGVWLVPSQTHPDKNHIITLGLVKSTCTCEDYQHSALPCKHIFAVQIRIADQLNKRITKIKERPTYPQDWKAYNQAQTHEKELFMKLLYELCLILPEEPKTQAKGRPRLCLGDVVFSSALKVYTTFSLRRFMCDMRTARKLDYIKRLPHFSMVSYYMEKKELSDTLLELITLSSLLLKSVETKFAIDSSGFRTTRFNEYLNEKHSVGRYHSWLKAHVGVGIKTNIITAVNITYDNGSDHPEFIPLANQTLKNGFTIDEMSADKAYFSADNLSHIVRNGGTPFIPFKTNSAEPNKGHVYIWKKMYNYFTYNREEFMEHYHLRSNVETTFSMMKAKFTDMIRSKYKTAQMNEVLLKVLCHNICVLIQEMAELGIEPNFVMGD